MCGQLIIECQACIDAADALLERGRGPHQRRLERIRTADRLRREAELPSNSGRRRALVETARSLENRAGQPTLQPA